MGAVAVTMLVAAPAGAGQGGEPAPAPAPEMLQSEQAAASQRSTIPAMTPSADFVLADAQRAAVGQFDPAQFDDEGGFPLTWAWIALATILILALASGDSRLRMQTPDHPEWERPEQL